nr:uncharacterized protein CI109_001845 [Kwoniella shandongensis]KAA5529905.1 hypothetical protein CI109_001845 [Kwoniella shandongensis]
MSKTPSHAPASSSASMPSASSSSSNRLLSTPGLPPLTHAISSPSDPLSPLLVTPSPPKRTSYFAREHVDESQPKAKRPRLRSAAPNPRLLHHDTSLTPREAKTIVTTLHHISNLIHMNDRVMKEHKAGYLSLMDSIEKRLAKVEERLEEVKEVEKIVKGEVRSLLKTRLTDMIDAFTQRSSHIIQNGHITLSEREVPFVNDTTYRPEVGMSPTRITPVPTEFFTPEAISELDFTDYFDFNAGADFSDSRDVPATIDPLTVLPTSIGLDPMEGPTLLSAPITSVVEAAIEAERERLGGVPVLREGESAVQFTMRKRLHRIGQELGMPLIDMSNLNDSDSDSETHLSSGVESLPDSEPLPLRVRSPPINIELEVARSRSATWNPFPHPYMRQGSVVSRQTNGDEVQGEGEQGSQFVRGASLIEDNLLAPGEGEGSVRGVKWPKYGVNSVKGRMQEITCDICGGRVHWACAGLTDGASMWNEAWSCPECVAIQLESAEAGSRAPSIPRSQQERSQERIVRKPKDDDEFYLERIIGRRSLGRQANGKKVFMYLIKWWDWQVYDATWEPAKNIPDLKRNEEIFLHSARENDINVNYRIALLPEAQLWFTEKGEYKKDLLRMLGVDERAWWDD